MNTFSRYARLVGVGIVFSIALPAYAKDASPSPNKIYSVAKPTVARGTGPSRAIDVQQPTQDSNDAPATTKKKADAVDPSITPYVTYEGATNTNTER